MQGPFVRIVPEIMKDARLLAALVAIAFLCSCFSLQGQKRKKKEEEVTQTLEVLPDPPAALQADTSRLTFHVSPMSVKGLLSQQVRESIKALWRLNNKGQIVRLRAFVAGTGDLRRVQSIVSEMFSERRLPLPVLSVVQVGLLPAEGAQVVIESISVDKKPVNKQGLAFVSGQAVSAPLDPSQPNLKVAPLAEKSIANLGRALASVQLEPKDVLRVTCFVSSLDDYLEVRRLVASGFPSAAANIVQIQRAPAGSIVECESVARLREPPGAPLKLVNPAELEASPNYSHVALVGSPKVVLSGAQLGFRTQDSDVRLAFERLKSSVEQAGGALSRVAMSSIYPLSPQITAKIRAIRFDYYDKQNPPASTMLLFEGLPSLEASFAVDIIGIPARAPSS